MSLVDDRAPRGDRWATPQEIFQAYHEQYRFTVDAAATMKNRKVPRHFNDGLRTPWIGERAWCNPPYSHIDPWIPKGMEADLACFLLPTRTDRPWFTHIWDRIEHHPRPGWEVHFPEGRIRFEGAQTDPNWPSMLCVWNAEEATHA